MRKDLVDPAPQKFADFWDDRFADKRGTYVTYNELFQTWFIMSSLVFGKDEYDIDAGLKAVQDAMPLKISVEAVQPGPGTQPELATLLAS